MSAKHLDEQASVAASGAKPARDHGVCGSVGPMDIALMYRMAYAARATAGSSMSRLQRPARLLPRPARWQVGSSACENEDPHEGPESVARIPGRPVILRGLPPPEPGSLARLDT